MGSNSTQSVVALDFDGILSDCASVFVTLIPHALLLLVIGPYLCVQRWRHPSPAPPRWVRYPGHNARWIFSSALIYMLLLETVEGILVDYRTGSWHVHTHMIGVVAILATVFTLVLYDFIETHSTTRTLVILLLYWLCVCTVKILRLASFYAQDLDGRYICIWLCAISVALCLSLLFVDVYVLWTMKYLCHNSVHLVPPEELKYLKYVHPYTSLLSRATCHWLNPLLAVGYRKTLDLNDLGELPATERSQCHFDKFKSIFEEEKTSASQQNKKPSLWRCYWRCYWHLLALAGLYKLISDLLLFVAPLSLDFIVQYVIEVTEFNGQVNATATSQPVGPFLVEEFFRQGYVLVILILGATLLQGTLWQNNLYLCVRQGIRLKGALQSLVFDKTLRLSLWSLGEGGLTAGQVMNHMAIDCMHLFHFFYWIHFVWALPLQVALTFVFLYLQLGVSALISAAMMVLLLPVQYLVGRHLAQMQKEALELADTRLKQSNEVLQCMKLLKLYAWELAFQKGIEATRRKELKFLLRAALCRIISILITDGSPVVASMITFTLYPYLENKPIQASKIFSGLALFNIMGLPLYLVTLIINIVTHAKISTDRLLPFLLAPEAEAAKMVMDVNEGRADKDLENVPEVSVVGNSAAGERAPVNGKHATNDIALYPLVSEPLLTTDNQASGHPAVTCDSADQDQAPCDEKSNSNVTNNVVVEVQGGNFSWDLDGKEVSLKDINFQVKKGELVMVVGSVGAGKSSLLSALMGEMTTVGGSVQVEWGSGVAYGSQKAWLMNDSLKENILFGKSMDETRYNQILDACALRQDIAMLPGGDETEIGEKGINLSGGQKQRISIARTLYSDTQLILLDDPLSALDVHVGAHIFKHAFEEYLIQEGKTIILVTHQLQYLTKAHRIIVMRDGKIGQQGTLDELSQADSDMVAAWNEALKRSKGGMHPKKKVSTESAPSTTTAASSSKAVVQKQTPRPDEFGENLLLRARLTLSMQSLTSLDDDDVHHDSVTKSLSHLSIGGLSKDKISAAEKDEQGRLIQEEERETGSVSWAVYLKYARAATGILTFLMIFTYIARQAMRMGTDFWLAEWSEQSQLAEKRAAHLQTLGLRANDSAVVDANGSYDLEYYVRGYAIMSAVSIVMGLISIIFLEVMCLKAAYNFHHSMLTTIIRAPMRFFDTTPLGRIINRLSGDTNIIDERMPVMLDGVMFCVLYVLGGLVLNAVATPIFLLSALPMLLIYLAVQRYYITSSRELQRLDCLTKSPILAHFSETLGGLATIRAYRDAWRFKLRNWRNIDNNNTAFMYLHTANIWMGIRLDYLGAFIVFTAAISSLTSGIYGYATPGIVGLAIAYAIMISGFVNWLMRIVSEAEMYFTSVERVSEFTEIPPEPVYHEREVIPDASWPKYGNIMFENVSLRYDASLNPVIHDMTLQIRAGEKIGVCGRTGSGKSSMTLGLFRMIDLCEGRILIDDHDISHVPLGHLRSRLAIIPQDPVLFEGTVRYNLDPMELHTDEEVWKALEIAQLKDIVDAMPLSLGASVTEGGENFSVGQRQLFCIARAFLRDARILVMDEATASIDMETDALLQKVIATAFAGKTVITIAHRVATILNSDMVLVLEDGRIKEHGPPQQLLAADGIYASMVHDNK